jgi:pilus assembly protein CpaD
MTTTRTGRPRLLAVALMAGLLAGCGSASEQLENQLADTTQPARDFPYAVMTEQVAVPVLVPLGEGETRAAVERELDRVFDDFLRSGGERLRVEAPLAPDRADAAARRVDLVRTRALLRGLLPEELDIGYRPDAADAPVAFRYTRYVVTTADCGDFSKPAGWNAANTAHSNFGCAYQHNLAVMASNPADLERARPMTPTDGDRKSLVLRNYRQGQPTDATLSGQATAPPIPRYGQIEE